MDSFSWDPVSGEAWLAGFGNASPGSTVTLQADNAQQALMTALVHAELFAADKGLAVPVNIGGTTGYVIGGARKNAVAKPTRDGIAYLAMQAAVRQASAQISPSSAASSSLAPVSDPNKVGVAPLVVGLIVVGVAAIIGTAYWAGHRAGEVEAQAEPLIKVHAIDQLIAMKKAGQSLTIDEMNTLIALAKIEKAESSTNWPLMIGGGIVLLAGGAWAFKKWK